MGWQDDPVLAQTAQSGQPAWMSDPVSAPTQPKPQESEPSFIEDLGRNVAMKAGAFAKGAMSIVALPADLATMLYNAGASHGEPYTVTMDDGSKKVVQPGGLRTLSQAVGQSIDSVTPQPRNATERVTNRIVEGLGGAAGGVSAGRAAAGAVGDVLAAQPGAQAAGAIAGSGASQLTAEGGGGAVAQTVAGLVGGATGAGGLTAGAAGVRGAFRGGEAGRAQMADTISSFKTAGAAPSVGQATGGRSVQAAESLLSRVPGAAGRMASTAENQAADLGSGVEKQAASLSPRASAEQAGRAIESGVKGEGGFVEQFKAKQAQLYDELDHHVQPQTGVDLKNTTAALAKLNAAIPGAPNTSKFFQNAKMQSIASALGKDLEQSGTQSVPQIAELEQAIASGGTLPYEAIKKLRTLVGNEMADSSIMSDVPRSKWKALYGALSADMEGAATAAGPEATAAWKRANNYTRAGMQRLEVIDHVIGKNGGPEAVFSAATSGTKEGATTLRAVMQSLPEDAQKTVSATVLRRLGRATPGKQNDLGEKFSTETFLTNWNSMSSAAKAALFDRHGDRFRQNMDQVARVASNLRDGSQVFRNPSGTAHATAQLSAAAGFVTALASGHTGAAAGIAGGIASANLAARLMTNPRFVRWLATSTKAPAAAAPALLNQLAQSNDDPDIAEFIQQAGSRSQGRAAR